jgi:hypothetical protein
MIMRRTVKWRPMVIAITMVGPVMISIRPLTQIYPLHTPILNRVRPVNTPRKNEREKLNQVIRDLTDSLDPAAWIDQTRLR